MKMGFLLRTTAVALVALLAGCATTPRAPYPHESILTVIAELKIFLDQDPYREPPGQDLNGRNIFRVSLERLTALEELADPQYGDVLAFAKGQCLERLGKWKEARAAFDAAAGHSTTLAAQARTRSANAARLAELTANPSENPTFDSYLNAMDLRERRLNEWLAERPPWPYDAYARMALERTAEARARLLFTNRMVLESAGARALETAHQLTEAHKDSWRISEHRLRLGECYEILARDWAAQRRPEQADFTLDPSWLGWIEQARQAYRRVAQTDGDPAKLEAQGRLRALDAFALRVQSLAR